MTIESRWLYTKWKGKQVKDKGLGGVRCMDPSVEEIARWESWEDSRSIETHQENQKGLSCNKGWREIQKGAVFGDIEYSIESKGNNGKYSPASAIRRLLKTFKRTSKYTSNKSRNEEVGLHQSEMLLHRQREQSTQWKGDLWNCGKYLQTIYLMRRITFQNKYKALMQLNSKNQTIQSKNGQRDWIKMWVFPKKIYEYPQESEKVFNITNL